MRDKIFSSLQNFSKSMFIPVLILPIAGLIIAFGNILTNARLAEYVPLLENKMIFGFGKMLSGSLVSILVNLGVIFCVGLAIGLAKKKKAEAGFTAMLAFLVFINAMNIFLNLSEKLADPTALRGTGQAMVLGVQILDMGVFLGIILGCVVAFVHNKYCEKQFSGALQIYGETRFVFIVLIPVIVGLAVVLCYVWPPVQAGINSLGNFINRTGNFGLFTYGALERLLIPTGLHHLVYTPFLYTSLGGSVEVGGQLFEGSRNIYFAEMADPTVLRLSESVIWDARGLSKMFGLVGACLAMYHTALPENKTKIKAVLIPAAITSILAGVTEPIEFSFLFVAPILFVLHAALSGLGMVVLHLFDVRAIGPNGLIDFLLYNVPLGIEKTNWPMYLLIGVGDFFVYYGLFRLFIQKFNLKTPGRESTGEAKLYTKQDYKEKNEKAKAADSNTTTNVEVDENEELGSLIVTGLGGPENIEKVDNCYTRLRLVLKDTSLVNEALLKEETNATAVIIKGQDVQVVYGLKVNSVRRAVDAELGIKES